MEKLGLWVAKHRWFLIVLFVGVTIFMAFEASKVQIIDDITKYVPKDDPQVSFFNKVADEFNMNDFILVGMKYDDLFSRESLLNVYELTKGLQKINGVKSVLSLVNAPWIEKDGDSVRVTKIENMLKSAEPTALKSSVMKSPLFKGQFVSNDGHSTMIMVSLNSSMTSVQSVNVTKEVEDYVNSHSKAKSIYYTGIPPSNLSGRVMALKNLKIFIPLSLAAVAIVLMISFGNLVGFLLPLLSVIVSSIWSIGLIHLLGYTMTLANVAIPVIVISLGNAYGIYVVNKYLEEKDREHFKRVSYTLRDVGIAVILSALTTIASFLSLLTVNINPVKYFGIFTAVGIGFALLTNLFFTPALVSFSDKHISSSNDEGSSFWRNQAEFILKHKWLFVVFVLIFVGIFGVFTTKIQSDMRLSVLLGKKNDVVKSMDYFADNFGGSDFIIVDFKGDSTDPYLLRSENLISLYALNHSKCVGGYYSLSKIMRQMNDKFNGQNYIPASSDKVQDLWFLMQGNDLSQIVNSSGDESVVQLKVIPSSLKNIEALKNSLESFIDEHVFKRYSYVELSKCDEVEKESAIKAMVSYVQAYMEAKNLKVPFSLVRQTVEKAMNVSTSKILKVNALKATDELMDYLDSFGMLEGISSDTISKLKETLFSSFKNGYSAASFEKSLKMKIGETNAQEFAPIIESQIPNVSEKFKVAFIKDLFEPFKGLDPSDIDELSFALSDEIVAVPTPKGTKSFKIGITGIPVVYNYVSDMLMRSQYESMFISAIIVFVLLTLQMSSILMGLIGLIPVALTVVFNFSVMGFFHIPLNAITITIASMTIGVGVDYVVQMFSRFKIEFKKFEDAHKAIVETLATSGKGILFNSLASSAGFATLFTSNMEGLKQFGILAISTMMVALMLAIFILVPVLSSIHNGYFEKIFKIKKER